MEPSEFWSVGDYGVVGDLWSQPGRDLAESLDVQERDVIDLATGTGVTAIALAHAGARSVIGIDVTPVLLSEAARRAEAAAVTVEWIEADVMSIPLPTDSADLVTSTFGIVFAADPKQALDEARRLTRPDGDIVFTSWSAAGLFGQVRRTLAPYFPDAPEPWHETPGDITAMVGDDARVEERTFNLTAASPEAFIDLLEQHSSPIVLATRTLGERWPQARKSLLDIVTEGGSYHDGVFRISVPYLVTSLNVR
ncbi:class I SAM-dependent methyltransferase [Phytoactinopolyspora endophytica]|uniref:class I SAM-dependent methyltransferase n=1 Tax=Phytoactinopolyspora endophytica TaxID=1642495 RepID=UPI00101D6512|nr:class I SAM-dependent methyltransferase [Phytoactinopolyspora endophytica]